MRFLVDAQLPPGLARRLASAGHVAVHVFEIPPADASDADVAAASRLDAILLSKDEDFVFALTGRLLPPLLWIRSGNLTTARLGQALEPLLPEIESAFASGERIVEIR